MRWFVVLVVALMLVAGSAALACDHAVMFLAGSQSIPTAQGVAVNLDTVSAGAECRSGERPWMLVAQRDGLYFLRGVVTASPGTGELEAAAVAVRPDGPQFVLLAVAGAPVEAAVRRSRSETLLRLRAGDHVSLRASQTSGHPVTLVPGASSTFLIFERVGE